MPALPYGFVPVVPRVAVSAAPVFHHGDNPDQETLLSGELRLTLKTLTPLLIGHDRYRADQAKGQAPFEQGLVRLPGDWGIAFPVKKEKSIVEPLRLDGRVLIPGSALTGMLRHSLGALLSAPMERVTERTYSYRPNIAHAAHGHELLASRPAIVCAVDPVLKVRVLPEARAAVFLRGGRAGPTSHDHAWVWQQIGSPSAGDPVNGTFGGLKLDDYHHLVPAAPSTAATLQHLYFTYKGGMDGTGNLARQFKPGSETYRHALVSAGHYAKGVSLDIDAAVRQRYLDTQRHLTDAKEGHLSPRHPLVKDNNGPQEIIDGIEASKTLEVGQLIYVEVELDQRTQRPIRVTSLGHNHHYRVRYTDSVRERGTGAGSTTRPVLAPLPGETALAPPPETTQPDHAPPAGLSAARLLFGYASADAPDSGTRDIGKGDFRRLAGRLAFNMAVEQVADPKDHSRFLDNGRPVPLRVLGQPRPSAVECYLDQTGMAGNRLATYGDLPGQPGAELNGRKLYLHQPDAATDSNLYRLDSDLDALDGCPEKAVFLQSLPGHLGLSNNAGNLSSRKIADVLLARDAAWIKGWEDGLSRQAKNERQLPPQQRVATAILHSIPVRTFLRTIEHLQGEQAALARYVVKPGASFRCTLRFRDLRPWELGAVLLTLEPGRIADVQSALPNADTIRTNCTQARAEWGKPAGAQPLFAQKLGGGRPLGLGSVSVAIDRLAIWDGQTLVPTGHAPGQGQGVIANAFDALGERLAPIGRDPQGAKVITSWLENHRYRGQPRQDYPRAQDRSSGRHEIYIWHTQQRRAYAEQRRTR
jgi:hypothetical protein